MLLSPSFVRRRLRKLSLTRILLLALTLFLLDALFLISQLPASPSLPSHQPRESKRNVFVASIHHDSAPRLHATWTQAAVRLAERLGPHNVHFSIVQTHSADATRPELLQLKQRLDDTGVSSTITFGQTAFQLEQDASNPPPRRDRRPGWIWLPDRNRQAMRRVPLLAAARDQALLPLDELAQQGRTFDTVLWIDDDVVFDPEDVVALLDTRGGDYAAACATDFGSYPRLRDSLALRDDLGQPPTSFHWPWFSSPTSRSAAKAGDPVPVYSCWNGMVAFNAGPFYADPPLRFRAIDDSLAARHVEASERCLVHADNMPDASRGVWMNPAVRVGHSVKAYQKAKLSPFPGWSAAVVGTWANRLEGAFGPAVLRSMERSMRSRLREWSSEVPKGDLERYEPGLPCLMDDEETVKPKSVFKFDWHQYRYK